MYVYVHTYVNLYLYVPYIIICTYVHRNGSYVYVRQQVTLCIYVYTALLFLHRWTNRW